MMKSSITIVHCCNAYRDGLSKCLLSMEKYNTPTGLWTYITNRDARQYTMILCTGQRIEI